MKELRPEFDQAAAGRLYDRLRAFQNEYDRQRWGSIRVVRNWNLVVVEKALAIMLGDVPTPSDGYRLAADYCRHSDPHYGGQLCGPSETKILEIVRFMFTREALEDWPTTSTQPSSRARGKAKQRGKVKRRR